MKNKKIHRLGASLKFYISPRTYCKFISFGERVCYSEPTGEVEDITYDDWNNIWN